METKTFNIELTLEELLEISQALGKRSEDYHKMAEESTKQGAHSLSNYFYDIARFSEDLREKVNNVGISN